MTTVSNITTGDAVHAPAAPKSRLVTRDPNRIEFAKDSTGRLIGAKPIDAIGMFDVTLLLGEHSGNGAALNQALMASSVVKINDRDVFRPATMVQLRARIQELGFHGYAAASECVARFNAEDGDVNKDALGN